MKNRYGNAYGFHTPELTKQVIFALQGEFDTDEVPIEDCSWHNDLADSIVVGHLQVYLPNSFVDNPQQELFSTFHVRPAEMIYVDGKSFDTWAEVVEYLHANLDVKDGREGRITITRRHVFTGHYEDVAINAGVNVYKVEEALSNYVDYQVGLHFDASLDTFKQWVEDNKDDYQ